MLAYHRSGLGQQSIKRLDIVREHLEHVGQRDRNLPDRRRVPCVTIATIQHRIVFHITTDKEYKWSPIERH